MTEMKRNSILFVAALMTLFLSVACGRNAEFVTSSYVTLHKTSYSISEEIGELKIPVLLKNAGGADAQVVVKVSEDTALEGVDYEIISPANGILYFSGQTDSLDIVIEITPFRGEEGFTLDKDFSVEIQSVTDGIHLGNLAKTNVTIVDLDHPLAPFVGEWTGVMTGKFDGSKYETTFKIASVRKDDTYSKVTIDAGINPFFVEYGYDDAIYKGVVKDNLLVISRDQSAGLEDFVLMGFDSDDSSTASGFDDIRFEIQEDGTLVQINAFGAYTSQDGGGFAEIYLGGAEFTKE